jgi:LPS sulfotransferase NodH
MQNFIILSLQRSGSTYLHRLLDNHSQIECRDEIYRSGAFTKGNFNYYCNETLLRKIVYLLFKNKQYIAWPASNIFFGKMSEMFLKEVFSNKADCAGFKLMYNQLLINRFMSNWIKKNGVKIIHLVRENALKLHLSHLTKQQRGVAHSEKTVETIKVQVNPHTLLDELNKIKSAHAKISRLLTNDYSANSLIKISYEELLFDYQKSAKVIFEFLGVPYENVSQPKLKKLNPDSVASIIKNYREIHQLLCGTEFEKFLDE